MQHIWSANPGRAAAAFLASLLLCTWNHAATVAPATRPADAEPVDTSILAVADPSVQADLGCQADQTRAIGELIGEVALPVWRLRDWPAEQSRDRLRPLIDRVESGLAQILTAAQQKRLGQIVLQVRGPDGLLWPQTARRLSLAPEQLDRIRAVLEDTRKRLAVAGELTADERSQTRQRKMVQALREREQDRLLEILTDEQEAAWKALRGKRLDLARLEPLRVPAPELVDAAAAENWIHSEPLTLEGLRGRVVVIHFWTYACINCIHNYEWYKGWQQDYASKEVTIIGIHTPETQGERDVARVQAKARENGLTFPILIDNAKRNWDAWGNSMWPSVYLIDRSGRVRYWWYGELKWGGRDGEKLTRARIEQLLKEVPPREEAP